MRIHREGHDVRYPPGGTVASIALTYVGRSTVLTDAARLRIITDTVLQSPVG